MSDAMSGLEGIGADPAGALRVLRRDRYRAMRAVHSLVDQIYPYYVGLLLAVYAGFALAGVPDTTVHGQRIKATAAAHAALPALGGVFVVATLTVLVAAAASAVDGGPVVLPPGDGKVLLTLPISRGLLVRRPLILAWIRAAGIGTVLGLIVLVAEVALLGRPAAQCAVSSLLLPPVVGIISVSVGWLVESSRAAHRGVRAVVAVGSVAGIGAAGYVAHGARRGPVGFWHAVGRIGQVPGPWAVVQWASEPGTPPARQGLGWAVIAVVAVMSVVAAVGRSSRITAQELTDRSGRASGLRAARFFADTSTLYLCRTRRSRMRHGRRWSPRTTSVPGALVGKALLQQQGINPIARILLAAATSSWLVKTGLHVQHHGHLTKPGQLGVLAAAVVLSAVGTRYADPLRLDLDRPDIIGQLPTSRLTVIRADLVAPWLQFMAGVLLAAVLAPTLGVLPARSDGILIASGALFAVLAVTAGATGLVAPSNVGFISPNLQLGLKLTGIIPTAIALELAAAALHKPHAGQATALVTIAATATVIGAIITALGARKLRMS